MADPHRHVCALILMGDPCAIIGFSGFSCALILMGDPCALILMGDPCRAI